MHLFSNYVNGAKFGAHWQAEKDKAIIDSLVENLSRIVDRIEENDIKHYFPSAFNRAKQLLESIKTK